MQTMKNTDTDATQTGNKIFLNGKQLADVLDVSAPTLSQAVKQGYNCGGHPVAEWAVETESGRIKGYKVPKQIAEPRAKGTNNEEVSANEDPNYPNEANIRPKMVEKFKKQATNAAVNNHYSLLPEGQNYVEPAGMMALPPVLKEALKQDTPQSRAVITGVLAIIGAITGHAVTDHKGLGAGIGAVSGLAIALLMYSDINVNQVSFNNLVDQQSQQPGNNRQLGVPNNESGYTSNQLGSLNKYLS